jgi:riboflavin kinase/FMN adenylyltransferase
MRIIRNILKRKLYKSGCILTIGNYDGLHIGHQEILRQMISRAKGKNLKTVVLTFYPRPIEFFGYCTNYKRLMTLREKICLLKKMGIDEVVCLKFDKKISEMKAEKFIADVLVKNFNLKEIFVGFDFSFGFKRLGDVALLAKLGSKFGFLVNVVKQINVNSIRVSSTMLRDAIESGDLDRVKILLGRNFSMIGRVVHGDRRGKTLGFPTANINMRFRIIPTPGVYLVKVHGLYNEPKIGIANIGFRPTIGGDKCFLEFYLFDFFENIYGKIAEVEFLHKLRDERKFDSLEQLKEQITQDVEQAKILFRGKGNNG